MITFVLKNPKSKIPTPIILTYYYQGYRMKLGVGESIDPKDWNQSTCRPRRNAIGSATLTVFLDKLEARVREVHLKLKCNLEAVTPAMLRDAIINETRIGIRAETLTDYMDHSITSRDTDGKNKSMDVHRSVLKQLKAYPFTVNFEDVNKSWFEKYQAWMEKKQYSANYIGKHMTIIREYMARSESEGLHRNAQYKCDYTTPGEDVESIYLTVPELMRIYQAPLEGMLDKVRNRFIIGAFTGLRFSDSSKITAASVRDGLLWDRNQKTDTQVVIPIHWVVEQIMQDHPDGLPRAISNQKTNKALKIIGQECGINTVIIKRQTKGGATVVREIRKYELITTHTARRSFATNAFLSGIPAINIMKITGHKTETSFMKYIRISEEENASLLRSHPYFVKP